MISPICGGCEMPVPIKEEEGMEDVLLESCCFCERETSFWTALKKRAPEEQVACCPPCAGLYSQRDVPTKAAWCDEDRQDLTEVSGDWLH